MPFSLHDCIEHTNLRAIPEVCCLKKVVSIDPGPSSAPTLNSSLNFNPSNSSSSRTVCCPSAETHRSSARSTYETTSVRTRPAADIAIPAFDSFIVAVMDLKDVIPAICIIIFHKTVARFEDDAHERHVGAVEQRLQLDPVCHAAAAHLHIHTSLHRRDSSSALYPMLRLFSCETFYLNPHFDLLPLFRRFLQIDIQAVISCDSESILLEDHIHDNSLEEVRIRASRQRPRQQMDVISL
jgi:hypothetical protein